MLRLGRCSAYRELTNAGQSGIVGCSLFRRGRDIQGRYDDGAFDDNIPLGAVVASRHVCNLELDRRRTLVDGLQVAERLTSHGRGDGVT